MPPVSAYLRAPVALLTIAILALVLGSCSDSTTPSGSAALRIQVEFRDTDPAPLARGEGFVYERVAARALAYDEETHQFGQTFEAEDALEPGETHFRLELDVEPATYYVVEVEVSGGVDADSSFTGVVYFGRGSAEDVTVGEARDVTVTLASQVPTVQTERLEATNEMRLSWSPLIEEATHYHILGTDNGGLEFEANATGQDTVFSVPPTFTGENLVRTFRVRAEFSDRAAGAYSSEASIDLGSPTAPGIITGFAATAITDSSLVLNWIATGDDGNVGRATSYDLRFSTSPIDGTNFEAADPIEGVPVPATAGTNELESVDGLEADTIYYFGLVAIDDADLRSPLAVASAQTLPEPDRVPPATIADLRTTEVTGTTARLLWTAPGDDGIVGRASRYEGRIALVPIDETNFETALAIPGLPTPSPSGTAESFLLGELSRRTTYYVALRAEDDEGNLSGIATTSFATPDLVPPAAVADLSAEALDETRVALAWTAPADEDGSAVVGYVLRWSTAPINEANFDDANETTAPSPGAPGSAEAVTLHSFSREMVLYFALRSYDLAGNVSALSNLASATTPDETPPAPPNDFAAEVVDETTLRVFWTATGDDGLSGNASTYDLRLSTAPIDETNFTSATHIPVAPPQETGSEESIEISGLLTGQLYYLRLRVGDNAGNQSDLSDLASATPTDLIAPAGSVLSVELTTASSVSLAWIAPGDDDDQGQAAAYDLRYSLFPIDNLNFGDATPVELADPAPAGSLESADINELNASTTYYFALVTEDEAGNRSPLSNVVSATTGTDAPAAPTSLAAAPSSPFSVSLVWQDNADNETGYEVERRRSDESIFTRIATTAPGNGVGSYEDETAEDRQTYTYRVRAVNAGGPSDYSNQASATTPVPSPETFEAVALANDEIRLSWEFPYSDPDGFRIERLLDAVWTTIADVPGDARDRVDTGLVGSTTYTYRMRAYDGQASSEYTPEVSETTSDDPPICSVSPSSIDFGTLVVGESDTRIVTITNVGGQILTGNVVLQDCSSGFVIEDYEGLALRNGESREVQVTFAPLDAGSASCGLLGPDCDLVVVTGIGESPFHWSDRFAEGDLGVDNTIRTFALAPDEGIFAGGAFTHAGSEITSYTAQFIPDQWFGMGPSLTGTVRTIAVAEYGIFCGGDFVTESVGPHHVAEWTGSSWAPFYYSPDGIVRTMVEKDTRVVVGGSFGPDYYAGGKYTIGPAGIAEWVACPPRFDGDAGAEGDAQLGCNFFDTLGNADPSGSIEALAVYQGDLYVGGTFTQIGGQTISYLARFQDSDQSWHAVGFAGGVNAAVYSLHATPNGLWVGGQFSRVDGTTSLGVAVWSGTSWIPRTAGEDFRTTYAITSYLGNVVVGGGFATSNGTQPLNRLAEWDGEGWLPLGSGIPSGFVYALIESDAALYVGGSFSQAGGLPSQNIGRWEPTPR